MRIVGVVGIMDTDYSASMWNHLGPAFEAHYPGAVTYVARADYNVWQKQAMQEFVNRIVAEHDTGEDILLIGHSMGGIVATAAASRFRKSNVVGVVTLYAPHTFLFSLFSRWLRCLPLKAPVVTFGAWIDILSPWGNRHPQSVCHTRLWTDHHHGLVRNRELSERIAAVAVPHLQGPSATR